MLSPVFTASCSITLLIAQYDEVEGVDIRGGETAAVANGGRSPALFVAKDLDGVAGVEDVATEADGLVAVSNHSFFFLSCFFPPR